MSAEITTTINTSAQTQVTSTTMTMVYSGGNINTAWTMISGFVSGEPGVTLDDAKHSMTMTDTETATLSDPYIAGMLGSGMQINNYGTKVKVPAGVMDDDSPEIILTKQ
jgi:hypothetical protein